MTDLAPPRSPWHRLGAAGAMVLGAVLLVAAWAKVLDPAAFAQQIELEGLDFLLPATVVAMLALALEVGLGSALLLAVRRLWVLVPSALLVAFFLFLTGRNYWLTARGLRSADEACGCFGNLVELTPAEAFWQDLLLLVPALVLAFCWRRAGSFPKLRVAVAALLTVAALVVAWKAPELPLDDLATRLKPGADPTALCAGAEPERVCLSTILPELKAGRHLVVLADLEDPAIAAAMGDLNEYALAGSGPQLWMLTAATDEAVRAFFWQWGPAFEIREAPQAVLKPLYRRLPRSFLVDAGRVEATFSGLPPLGPSPPGPTTAASP